MDEATIAITVMSGLIAAIFLGFLIWGWVTGQFRNVEEPARRMFLNNVQNQPGDARKEKTDNPADRPSEGSDRK